MANVALRLPENVPGDFFVDSTCIDCDACRQIAPLTFAENRDVQLSFISPNPRRNEPGIDGPGSLSHRIDRHDRASRCSPRHRCFSAPDCRERLFLWLHRESSFGAWSYLIVRPESEGGNVLIDSPRFATQLVEEDRAMGGVRTMFLTHKDDVADHSRFADEFGCGR